MNNDDNNNNKMKKKKKKQRRRRSNKIIKWELNGQGKNTLLHKYFQASQSKKVRKSPLQLTPSYICTGHQHLTKEHFLPLIKYYQAQKHLFRTPQSSSQVYSLMDLCLPSPLVEIPLTAGVPRQSLLIDEGKRVTQRRTVIYQKISLILRDNCR